MRNLVAALVVRFVDRLSQPARASARAVGSIERAQKAAKAAGDQWSRGLDELDGKMDRLAKASLVTEGLARAGEAMIRPLREGTAEAARFNAGMTGIGITAQLTDGQLQPLRNTILQTSTELGALPATVQATFNAVLAEGVYNTEAELSRAGVAVARFQRLQAAVGENLSDTEAGAYSAALGSSMKLRADQLDRANAMVNRSAQQGGVSGASLARALPAQTGALSGMSFANDVGLADLLAANQIAKRLAGSSDQATNNVTNLFAALASPEVIKNFSEIGINLEREIKRGVDKGVSPLETLATLVQAKTGGDQFRIGELFGDRQARDAVMALTQNLDDFRTMSRELQGDGLMPAYFADLDRAAQGPAASFARYQAATARAGIATGTILAPAVGLAADALGRIASWMSRATESGNPLARAAVWIVAGFAGLAVGAGAVGHALFGVLAPMYLMRSLFGTLGGAAIKRFTASMVAGFGQARLAAIGFNLAFLANPVVLAVVAAIAAIALVALVVRKYWQPIKAFFTGVGQALAEAFGPAIAEIGKFLAPLKPLWDGFASAVGGVIGWFGRLIEPVKSSASQLEGATSAGRRFGQGLVMAFNIITAPIRFVVGIVQFAVRMIKAALSFSPLQVMTAGWNAVFSWYAGLTRRFAGFGRAIMMGLVNGIRAMLGRVREAVMNTASSAVDWFKNRLGIRSPSRVFMGLGGDTMAGLTVGLNRGARAPLAAIRRVGDGLISAMPDAGGGFGGAAMAGAGGGRGVTIQKIEQHFHLPAGTGNPREIARELHRLSSQGVRAALMDADAL